MRGRNLKEHVLLPNGERREINRLYKGCWRIRLSEDRFGQVYRENGKWTARVQDTFTGSVVRYAGIWKSRRDALVELCSINPLDL